MHHANHFYGHAHIMARYAGLAEVPRIWGYLQHGWNIVDGFAVGTPFAPGFPKFVWSDAVRRRGWSMGRRDYVTVGSPWVYLLMLENQDTWEAEAQSRSGTIVYPFHGWEGQTVLGKHDGLIEEIRAREAAEVTVCLYWNEYNDPTVRRHYDDAGFRTICHGPRGFNWKGTDPEFLYKQLAELRRHRKVVSNRLSSAIFYGAAAGCDVGVYGDPMLLEAEDPVFGGHARLQRLWPALHAPEVSAAVARPLASRELGMGETLSPFEIVHAFGWEQALRRPAQGRIYLPPHGELSSAGQQEPETAVPTLPARVVTASVGKAPSPGEPSQ